MSNVFLFGPPGIGKSTLVWKFTMNGYTTLDFEKFWNGWGDSTLQSNRDNLMKIVSALWYPGDIHAVYGAGALDPKLKYPGRKVLLVLEQGLYEARRLKRDTARPEYAQQTAHRVDDWLDYTIWDDIVIANKGAFEAIVRILNGKPS